MTTHLISQLAERSGVPATTLRFYEDAGLLPADRTPSGYRVYGEDAVERLAFISSAKLLGLALEEIRDLLDVREEGVCASRTARMLPLIASRIQDTDSRAAELRAFSARLADVHTALSGPAPEGACGSDCGCTTTTDPAAGPVPVTLSRTRPAPGPAEEAWRDAPAACTLGGAELGERTEQWRTLVAKAEQREDIEDGLLLSFPPDAALAGQIAALAAAEQGCCAFFDFTLAGFLGGFAWTPAHWLSGAIGAGLLFSGVTNTCGMAAALAKLPHNRPPKSAVSFQETLLRLAA